LVDKQRDLIVKEGSMMRACFWNGLILIAALIASLMDRTEALAAPRKAFVIANGFSNAAGEVPNNPSDSLMFYDVTAIGSPGAANVFNNSPMFSFWMGYEVFQGEVGDVPGGVPRGDREEISAITFNPANGTVYVGSFDSGTPGTLDTVGDNIGDMDIYRIDYQEILKDYVTNNRPRGTIYAPSTLRITNNNEQFLAEIGSPLFDGTVDGIAHNVPHPTATTSTVFVEGAFQKIGEVGRPQSPQNPSFFDVELDFINPETLVFLDAATTFSGSAGDPLGDHQIRAWQRVSTTPGLATVDADGLDNATGPPGNPSTYDDAQGGYNGQSLQSWKSTIMARLQMDANITDVGGWAYVKRDGKLGVWVADNELNNTGDQVSYFELDFSGPTPTATKKTLPTSSPADMSFRVDENPAADATTNNGEIDFLAVDKNGNLVIGESGFFDTIEGSMTPPTGSGGLTAEQPRVLTVGIESYNNAAGVVPTGFTASGGATTFDSTSPWTVSASINPMTTDDTQVVNTTKVGYDRSTGFVYVVEQDSDFFEDLYVFDPATGTIVYHEINGLNPSLFNTGTQEVILRGDINGDAMVNQTDVATLQAAIADPTLGGTVSAALGAEWYDLTGDGLLTAADLTELQGIIGATIPGDFDGDGMVDGADLAQWRGDFGVDGGSDADGDGDSDGQDFLVWQRNLGATAAAPAAAAVPEPGSLMLLAVGVAGSLAARRRA
jgi:hypothetical protein